MTCWCSLPMCCLINSIFFLILRMTEVQIAHLSFRSCVWFSLKPENKIFLSPFAQPGFNPLISKHTESHYYSFHYETLHQSFGFTVLSWWWEMESMNLCIVIMKRVVIHGCFPCLSVLYCRWWGHPSAALHHFQNVSLSTFNLQVTPHWLLKILSKNF